MKNEIQLQIYKIYGKTPYNYGVRSRDEKKNIEIENKKLLDLNTNMYPDIFLFLFANLGLAGMIFYFTKKCRNYFRRFRCECEMETNVKTRGLLRYFAINFESLVEPIGCWEDYRFALIDATIASGLNMDNNKKMVTTLVGSSNVYDLPSGDFEIVSLCIGNSLRELKSHPIVSLRYKVAFSDLLFIWMEKCPRISDDIIRDFMEVLARPKFSKGGGIWRKGINVDLIGFYFEINTEQRNTASQLKKENSSLPTEDKEQSEDENTGKDESGEEEQESEDENTGKDESGEEEQENEDENTGKDESGEEEQESEDENTGKDESGEEEQESEEQKELDQEKAVNQILESVIEEMKNENSEILNTHEQTKEEESCGGREDEDSENEKLAESQDEKTDEEENEWEKKSEFICEIFLSIRISHLIDPWPSKSLPHSNFFVWLGLFVYWNTLVNVNVTFFTNVSFFWLFEIPKFQKPY